MCMFRILSMVVGNSKRESHYYVLKIVSIQIESKSLNEWMIHAVCGTLKRTVKTLSNFLEKLCLPFIQDWKHHTAALPEDIMSSQA